MNHMSKYPQEFIPHDPTKSTEWHVGNHQILALIEIANELVRSGNEEAAGHLLDAITSILKSLPEHPDNQESTR